MKNVQVTTFNDVRDLETSVSSATMSSSCRFVPGVLFRQGHRVNFATTLPVSTVTSALYSNRATKNSGMEEVEQSTQRPLEPKHVRQLSEYILKNANKSFILPSLTLNTQNGVRLSVCLPGNGGQSDLDNMDVTALAYLRITDDLELSTTDGQHRTEALKTALVKADEETRQILKKSCIPVMLTFESDVSQIHQDFADCSKNKPIAPSQLAVYDGRHPANAIVKEIVARVPLFKHTLDSVGKSISEKSVRVWVVNNVRQFAKYVFTGERGGSDDQFASKLTALLGDQGDEGWNDFVNYCVAYLNGLTTRIEVLNWISSLERDQLVQIPARRKDGDDLLMTGSGLSILGAVGHAIWQNVARENLPIDPWLDRIAAFSWKKNNPAWKRCGLVIASGSKQSRVQTTALAIKEAARMVIDAAKSGTAPTSWPANGKKNTLDG